jgi:ribosomal protein S18 acetylase RimI-like enzyme
MNGFNLREARPDERSRVAEFHIAIHFASSVRTIEEQKAQEDDLEDDYPHFFSEQVWNDTYTLIAETEQEELAGTISMSKNQLDKSYNKLHSFSVAEKYRRTGLGRALLVKLLQQAQTTGVKSLRLETLDDRMDRAIKLYEQNGFQKISSFQSPHYLVWTMEKLFS